MTDTATKFRAIRNMTRQECEAMLEQCRSCGIIQGSVVMALQKRINAFREGRFRENAESEAPK